jgi:23S rRNA pseudouridine2605 synthase
MAKKKISKPNDLKPQSAEPENPAATESEIPQAAIADPIGDETDGEAKAALEPQVEPKAETEIEANDGPEPESEPEQREEEPEAVDSEPEFKPKSGAPEDGSSSAGWKSGAPEDGSSSAGWKPRPPAKIERLQKILAKAGVASRRKAEELIEQGRVQVNGAVVTELGTKADADRDHIRVDGKLLQGAERLRYFVLNKPRGFVTTVKDPEGRPTVMQFFDKMHERLYPVGRLDYMSEGLLLVTNDGELANRLTRAAAGVEKTYLVKVAGQPSEAELDLLRGGVAIERGKPGSERVRTSPARVRQVRQGDNPWYEVVLIEGRNRELRKMFEEIGHFVEKIRRVGYGPLVLDQEPGNLRELDPQELDALRKVAEGKLRTPKAKELRRRNAADAGQLPTVAPRATGSRPARPTGAKPFAAKSFEDRPAPGPKDYRPKRSFNEGGDSSGNRARPVRPADEGSRPRRPAGRDFGSPRHTGFRPSSRPAWQSEDRPTTPPERFAAGSTGEGRPPSGKRFGAKPPVARPYGDRPAAGRSFGTKPPSGGGYRERPAPAKPDGEKPAARRPYGDRPAFTKPASGKPAWSKPSSSDRPSFKRPPAPPREAQDRDEDFGPVRPPNLHIEEIKASDRPAPSRSSAPRPYAGRPSAPRSASERSSAPRSRTERPGAPYSHPDRATSDRPRAAKPFRGEGGLARPYTTSSGKPRAGGARPSSKPGNFSKPAGRSFGAGPSRPFESKSSGPAKRPLGRDAGEGSFTPRPPRAAAGASSRPTGSRPPGGKPGWKPKPSYGGPGKPASGARSKPRPGSSAKSGYKGKPGGPKRIGSSGGKKRG